MTDSLMHAIVQQACDSITHRLELTEGTDSSNLGRMKEFYDLSWDHLITVASILGGAAVLILGVIIPIIQARKLKTDEEKLEKRFKEEIQSTQDKLIKSFETSLQNEKDKLRISFDESILKAKEEIKNEYKLKIEEDTKTLKEELKREIDFSKAFNFGLQARFLVEKKSFGAALTSYMNALKSFAKAQDGLNADIVINQIEQLVQYLKPGDLDFAFNNINIPIDKFFNDHINASQSEERKEKLRNLKSQLENIK